MEELYIIIFFVIIFLLFKMFNTTPLTKQIAEFDNTAYYVNDLPNKQKAANTIAEIRSRIIKFRDCLKKKYPEDKRIDKLFTRLNLDNLRETLITSDATSYSVNKGEEISFCVRDKTNPEKIHDINVIMFVTIHELGHVISDSIGHGQEFVDNFAFLLKEAIDCDVYVKQHFDSNPVEYCGVKITNELI
jgi:hypothetical protein